MTPLGDLFQCLTTLTVKNFFRIASFQFKTLLPFSFLFTAKFIKALLYTEELQVIYRWSKHFLESY